MGTSWKSWHALAKAWLRWAGSLVELGPPPVWLRDDEMESLERGARMPSPVARALCEGVLRCGVSACLRLGGAGAVGGLTSFQTSTATLTTIKPSYHIKLNHDAPPTPWQLAANPTYRLRRAMKSPAATATLLKPHRYRGLVTNFVEAHALSVVLPDTSYRLQHVDTV